MTLIVGLGLTLIIFSFVALIVMHDRREGRKR